MTLDWSQHKDGNWFASYWHIQLDILGMGDNATRRWSLRYDDWDAVMIGDYEDDPEVLKALAQRVENAMNGEDAPSRIEAEIRRLQDAQSGESYNEKIRIGNLIEHFDFVAEWLKETS